MILTFTPNPSIDVTLQLSSPLTPGEVHRLHSSSRTAGGKGVNVSHAAHQFGYSTIAIFPAADEDPFVSCVRQAGITMRRQAIKHPVRSNTTITDANGTTTKLNEPGPALSKADRAGLENRLVQTMEETEPEWVVFAGSLPPGTPASWYTDLIIVARRTDPKVKVAVDTSEEPLRALHSRFPQAAPDVMTPNVEELAQLIHADPTTLADFARRQEWEPLIRAAAQLVSQGVKEVMVTLGVDGALLVTESAAWHAYPPPISPKSTVGAGDASLAGYITADIDQADPPLRLAKAVATGTAATALPGTQFPSPTSLDLANTQCHKLRRH